MMSDAPGLPAGLGIDSVEWFAESDQNVTVRVTGRWRRRRPTWVGRPLLVIEEEGRRHRFPAMPEPPGVTGTVPGTWRMTFSVPASLAPHLRRSAWLKLGVAMLPLPVDTPAEGSEVSESQRAELTQGTAPESRAGEQASGAEEVPGHSDCDEEHDDGDEDQQREPRPAPDPGTIAARRLRSAELALEATRARVAEAEETASELAARVEQLADELAEAKREPERLNALLSERERRRRAAEQRAYAERALREELERELSAREHELSRSTKVRDELAALQQRLAGLAAELEEQRRRADEAEQVGAAARAQRARAEHQLAALRAELGGSRPGPGRARLAGTVRAEKDLVHGADANWLPPVPRVSPGRHDVETLALERAMVTAWTNAGERIVALERELEDQQARMRRAAEGVEAMRLQLDAIRLAREREPLSGPPAAAVEPERLEAARERLRAEAPATAQEPDRTAGQGDAEAVAAKLPAKAGKRWLAEVFRSITEEDAPAAGALALELMPALRVIAPEEQTFELVLEEVGRVRISVYADRVETAIVESQSDDASARFVITGDLAGLARLLVAGRVRRRVGRGLARLRGDRTGFTALQNLVRSPLRLDELHAAGVALDPWLAFRLVALMVKPAWTRGQHFNIAHREPSSTVPTAVLQVREGRRPAAARTAPLGAADATVICPHEVLLSVLAGGVAAELEVEGDGARLDLLLDWVKLAQSD